MAESESQERNYDNMERMMEDSRDLEELLDQMEKNTVQATWMTYNLVAIRTNPDLTNAMMHLEDAFLRCKEQVEKKWQETLMESRGEGQKKE
uniref:Synaptonemal complex central element protein 3 n=1 Tax=Malurus cyaneus samueli TaxID=2593467 RepID=A0A8C5X2R8_9PASS